MKNLILIYFIFHHGVNTSNATIIKRKIGQSYKLTCTKNEHKDVGGCYLQTPKGVIYVLWSGARWENGRILADINHPCRQTEVKMLEEMMKEFGNIINLFRLSRAQSEL